jgi:D-glycero-D-manno-heptose 1,7-bisphosphate phosphatase
MGEPALKQGARAVFLDRDGVINRPVVRDGKPYPPPCLQDFSLYPETGEACWVLKEAGYLLVVVTNQPDVGRGTQKQAIVEEMHAAMKKALPIDRVEVCYDSGSEASEFYKPAPGMLFRAAQELGIQVTSSYLVGDRWRDIDCGVAAGCRTIFVDRGYREALRCRPDHTVSNLLEAAKIIVQSGAIT